jgi:hypothetical protein
MLSPLLYVEPQGFLAEPPVVPVVLRRRWYVGRSNGTVPSSTERLSPPRRTVAVRYF